MRVIGMISGTSFDAIEAAAIECELAGDAVNLRLVATSSTPYPDELRDRLAAALPPNPTTMEEVCRLDAEVGTCFSDAATELAARGFGGEVDVICSHGQTVFHLVEDNRALSTLQIGESARLCEATGATVVHDVRSRDIAAGGQGAPLASLLDTFVLGSLAERAASLNLGGIANVTIVAPGSPPVAFDIGPANALLDAAIFDASSGALDHDHDGERAARGEVDATLLASLLDEPYYRLAPPKSTGKELFNLDYLRRHIEGVVPKAGYLADRRIAADHHLDDLLATLVALSVRSVADALVAYRPESIVVAGGGWRNPVLRETLRGLVAPVPLSSFDHFGIPESAKEAALFGLIGFLSVNGLAGNVPSCTGARRPVVLGSIIVGRQRLLAPPELAPTRLVVHRDAPPVDEP